MSNLQKTTLAFCLPIIMACIDVMALSVALNSIILEFHTPIYQTQWLFTAYMIANSAFLVSIGQLGDVYGQKRLLLISIFVFTIASLLAALSYNFWLLIIVRGLQGIASSGIMTTSIALMTSHFSVTEKDKMLAKWMFSVGAGLAFGPLVGGILTYIFDWRLIFLVNLPIGIFSYFLAYTTIPNSEIKSIQKKSTLINAFFLSVIIAALALILSEGNYWGWISLLSSMIILVLLMALVVFIYLEKKSDFPIIHLNFYKRKSFLIGAISGFFAYYFMYSWLFIFSLYLQNVRGLSSMFASFVEISYSIAFAFGPLILNKIYSHKKKYYIQFGFFGTFLAFTLMSISPMSISLLVLMLGFFILGLSIATINLGSMTIATHDVPKDKAGLTSGSIFTVRWLGGAIGVLVTTIIYHTVSVAKLKSILHTHIPTLIIDNRLDDIESLKFLHATSVITQVKQSLTFSLIISCIILACISLACFIANKVLWVEHENRTK